MKKYINKYTCKDYLRETTMSRSIRIIKYIQSNYDDNMNACVYARGNTFKSKCEIKLIGENFPVEIKAVESGRIGIWRVIPIPVSNYFLIKLNNIQFLKDFYNSINYISIITFYIFNKKFESLFLNEMTKEKGLAYIDPVTQDSSYFVYGIDTDAQNTDSGFQEYVSYGINAPKELVNFI